MEAALIVERLKGAFPEAVVAEGIDAIDPWMQVNPASVADVAALLKEDSDLSFDFLMAVTGIDLKGLEEDNDDLRVEYHFYSYGQGHTIVVRADVQRDHPVLPSLADVYPTANWNEREAWDLLGIRFEGHPDLRRILLPEEWEGHPLRKDWEEGDKALGFDTKRQDLLGMIRDSE